MTTSESWPIPGHDPDTDAVNVDILYRPAGVVAYRLAAPRVRGTIVVTPHVTDEEPVPRDLVVRFGDGDHPLATHRDDLPVVDGITVYGGGYCNPHHPDAQPNLVLRAAATVGGALRPAALPVPAHRYLLAVLDGVLQRHRQLDLDALAMAAARASAAARLRRHTHGTILPAARLLAEITAECTAAHELASQLQELSPLRLLPEPAPQRCCRLPAVDPETLVTATDDGDWLTCTGCATRTVLIEPGMSLVGLLQAHATHRCGAPPS
ncbi:hypothetical protein [Dactylosporangium sp. CA-233914]|uniref:hypothetical protein n=1 Tax=Dactylosporangium sp. CA-233914 TaxID=3239934 RepID=UPI003D913E99